LQHSIKWKGEVLGIAEMKRHYTNYFKGIPHFKAYRIKLVTYYNLEEIMETLDKVAVEFEGVKF
jgi:tRNA-dihydrouridine synthase